MWIFCQVPVRAQSLSVESPVDQLNSSIPRMTGDYDEALEKTPTAASTSLLLSISRENLIQPHRPDSDSR
ncbi:MAG: hypothetical protein ACI9OD_002735 [Limisphaerales bacterium]|jgi:hypothetical protein